MRIEPPVSLPTAPMQSPAATADALVVSGVYSIEGSLFHVGLALVFGAIGYGMRVCRVPVLPMVLGVVLGFMVESNYRRALVLSGGDHWTFVQDRISAALLLVTALVVIGSLVRHMRDTRGSGDDRIVAGGQHT